MAFCMESEHEESNGSRDVLRRAQWLRAAILGANDGLLSTTSLMLGVGAAKESRQLMVLSGVAGAVAGALSMAVGEFVSVSTQRDIEMKAAVKKCSLESSEQKPEKVEMKMVSVIVDSPASSCRKLQHVSTTAETTNNFNSMAMIMSPGRSPTLRVMAEDISNSKAKRGVEEVIMSELGKDNNEEEQVVVPNPYKAAAASALAFLCGSVVPLAAAMLVAGNIMRVIVVVVASSLALVVFGGVGAHLGGSPVKVSAFRVLVGGWIAMGITYGLLKPFDKDNEHQGLES